MPSFSLKRVWFVLVPAASSPTLPDYPAGHAPRCGPTASLIFVFLFQFVMSGWGTGYSFRCDIVDYSQSPRAMRVSFSSGKSVASSKSWWKPFGLCNIGYELRMSE